MGMEQIEHVVVLMLENRSFDSLLGWLYEDPRCAGLNIARGACRVPAGVELSTFMNTALQPALPPRRPGRGGLHRLRPRTRARSSSTSTCSSSGPRTPAPGAVPTMTGVLEDFVR